MSDARRHIGGSVLPPNDPQILQPINTPFGILQVRVLADADTHGLFLSHSRGETLLVTHPNGYACHNLGQRMIAGNPDRVLDQAQYIVNCGGTSRKGEHLIAAMQPEPRHD